MAWQSELRSASFRGVPFETIVSSPTFGRRIQVHVYPRRDRPFAEDLGRKPREFRLSAVIAGDDYPARRDRLIAACEQPGPGTLVHPLFGEMEVACTECSLIEAADSGGSAHFDLSFVEVGILIFPRAIPDGEARVNLAAGFAQDLMIQEFSASSARETLRDVQAAIDTIRAEIDERVERLRRSTVGVAIEQVIEAVDQFKAGLDAAKRVAEAADDSIVRFQKSFEAAKEAATAIGEVIADLTKAIGAAISDAMQRLRLLASLAELDPGVSGRGTMGLASARLDDRRSLDSMVALTRRLVLVEAARAAARLTFASRNEAIAIRDDLADRLDREAILAADAGQDVTWRALTDVRAQLVAHLTVLSETLARVLLLELTSSVPALVLAYDLYEDATRDAELVRRNAIAHEGLLPVAVALEALTR